MNLTDLLSYFSKKKIQQTGLCGLSFVRDGMTFAKIDRNGGDVAPALKSCDYLQTSFDPEKILHSLTALVRTNNCLGMPCNWVLQPKDYELISIPNLPVSAEELPTALRWHVKDQIDFPIAEAVIDYFKVPYLTKTQNEELIYVIVAKKNYLDLVSNIIVEAGLNLNVIEIPEFALRNLAELFSEKGQSLGIVEINHIGAKLIIVQDGFVYLVRQVEMELRKSQSTEELSVLVTEIQRSCDYYENGLGQAPVSKFLLVSADVALAVQLTEKLGVPVESMDLDKKFTLTGFNKEKGSHCLYAVGGALRREEGTNEATG